MFVLYTVGDMFVLTLRVICLYYTLRVICLYLH